MDLQGSPLLTRVDSQVDFNWAELKSVAPEFNNAPKETLTWPAGVRRYSYRKDPDLPAGNAPKADKRRNRNLALARACKRARGVEVGL